MRKIFSMAAITAVMLIVPLVWHFAAHAHDHSRPELNSSFEGLQSGKGPCCSGADGTALSDGDWEVRTATTGARPTPMVGRAGAGRDQGADRRRSDDGLARIRVDARQAVANRHPLFHAAEP